MLYYSIIFFVQYVNNNVCWKYLMLQWTLKNPGNSAEWSSSTLYYHNPIEISAVVNQAAVVKYSAVWSLALEYKSVLQAASQDTHFTNKNVRIDSGTEISCLVHNGRLPCKSSTQSSLPTENELKA